MEESFREIAGYIALATDAAAALMIAFGAIEALCLILYGAIKELSLILAPPLERRSPVGMRRTAWVRFGVWLLLGLEFQLGADIIRTAIAPTWTEIGQLGAIALIRTFLNYYLKRDLEDLGETGGRGPTPEHE
jgi:uncharacterized membrane protein